MQAIKKGRILCVDDEPAMLRSLRWQLQREFEVEVAGSGAVGLQMVRASSFDVVVSDQRMPGMTGSEFLREVREISPGSMRILLTGYSDLQALVSSVNEGEVFRFINKPWKYPDLLQAVGEAVQIARTSPPVVCLPDTGDGESIDLDGESILVIDDDPEIAALVRESVGPMPALLRATDLAQAAAAFEQHEVGIVVSNMRVGGVDASRMIKQIKRRHPGTVAVVYTDATDAVDVMGLINQAQVYRFLPRPTKPTMLRIALASAALKRRQLRSDPAQRARHVVEQQDEESRNSLVNDIKIAARSARPVHAPHRSGFLFAAMGSRLMRLFGRA